MNVARIANAAPCQVYCWVTVLFKILGVPFRPVTNAYLFSHKCNPEVYKLSLKNCLNFSFDKFEISNTLKTMTKIFFSLKV